MKTETVKATTEDLTMSERVLMCIIWISSTFTAAIFVSIGYMLLTGTAHATTGNIQLEYVDAQSTLIRDETEVLERIGIEAKFNVRDFTLLQPEVHERKYFVPGIGVIVDFDLDESDNREDD